MTDRTDTERLDWLENSDIAVMYRFCHVAYIEAGNGKNWLSWNYRDAIDAAMDGERGDE